LRRVIAYLLELHQRRQDDAAPFDTFRFWMRWIESRTTAW